MPHVKGECPACYCALSRVIDKQTYKARKSKLTGEQRVVVVETRVCNDCGKRFQMRKEAINHAN